MIITVVVSVLVYKFKGRTLTKILPRKDKVIHVDYSRNAFDDSKDKAMNYKWSEDCYSKDVFPPYSRIGRREVM